MKIIREFVKKFDWGIIIVVLAGILASRTLLFQSGYFVMHDDLQMMRQLSMEKCFMDLQIPCRWIPDMGYGYGFPLFNFYPPLPYLVGEIFRLFGFTFVNTVKITFALSIIFSGVAMYALAKKLWGRLGGILSSIFYIWAPYHAVDVYVRGAMNESWALVFFPLIFLYSYLLINEEKKNKLKWIIYLALSLAGLLLSHNLMVLIFTPFVGLWVLLWMYKTKRWENIKQFVISGTLGLGISAFFTLPAVLENNLTWLKTQLVGYYDYSAHFATLNQLFITRFWGYGPSIWLEADGMPFQIGHLHWISSLLIIGYIAFIFVRSRKTKKKSFSLEGYDIAMFLFGMGWISAFMNHQRATPIYQMFPFLGLVQFPWRFLTLVIFSLSLLIGIVIVWLNKSNKKYTVGLVTILSLGLIILNWNYFLPFNGKMGALSDSEKFSGAAWDLQQTAGIYDYLPLTAIEAPKAPQKVLAEFLDEKGSTVRTGNVLESKQGTNWVYLKLDVQVDEALVRINIFDFPKWNIYLDGSRINSFLPESEKWGRMWIKVPKGEHIVEAKFVNTPIRSVSNIISIIALITTGYLALKLKK